MSQRPPAPSRDDVLTAGLKVITENPFFELGEAEIRGATYRVFKNAPASIGDILVMCDLHADKDAVVSKDRRWSYGELARHSRTIAAGLAKMGVKKGTLVATATRNTPEWMATYLGVILLGGIIVPLNGWWTGPEMDFALTDCDAKIVICDAEQSPKFLPLKEKHGLTLISSFGEFEGQDRTWAGIFADGEGETPPPSGVEPDDVMAIMYTSGSTGDPKGVMLTHRGAWSTLLSFGLIGEAVKLTKEGEKLIPAEPAILVAVPFFHVTGTHPVFLLSILMGRKMVLMQSWKPKRAVELITREKITNFVGVPTMSAELMAAAEEMGASLESMMDFGSGGAKRPAEQVGKLAETFDKAYSSSGYGLSETSALGTYIGLEDYQRKPGAAGRAVPPVTDVKTVLADGSDAPLGERGEVWIKTPAVFAGYLNLPEETAKALTADGWVRTGDIGVMDEEGMLTIVDRMKDMIVRGGENVACLEVEAALIKHPDIIEAAVFAVPDERLGETVGAALYVRDGAEITVERLADFFASDLAAFKRPEHVWNFDEPLPRVGSEKVDKPGLRKICLSDG